MKVSVRQDDKAAVLRPRIFTRLLFPYERAQPFGFCFEDDKGEALFVQQKEIDITARGLFEVFADCFEVMRRQCDAELKLDVCSASFAGKEAPTSRFKELVDLDACGGLFQKRGSIWNTGETPPEIVRIRLGGSPSETPRSVLPNSTNVGLGLIHCVPQPPGDSFAGEPVRGIGGCYLEPPSPTSRASPASRVPPGLTSRLANSCGTLSLEPETAFVGRRRAFGQRNNSSGLVSNAVISECRTRPTPSDCRS
jgi:hypothetical protein